MKDVLTFPIHLCLQLTALFTFQFFKQIQAGLSALEDALKAGFEDFKVTYQFENTMVCYIDLLKKLLLLLTENPD